MRAPPREVDFREILKLMEPGEAPCGQAQADGVPCLEPADCVDCPEGRRGMLEWVLRNYGIRIKQAEA
ncbi:MAG: hypothetical protein P8174_02025 [Gemmatimonadota bacterium]